MPDVGRYEELEAVTRSEAEAARRRDDPSELHRVVISVGLNASELDWSEAFCLRLSRHVDEYVRGNALLALGYLAMHFQRLERPESVAAVRAGLADASEWVCGQADGAADDIEHFARLRVRAAPHQTDNP